MPSRKLTAEELKRKRVDNKAKTFMDAVEKFIKSKNSGEVEPSLMCALDMIERYYKEYIMLSNSIDELDSLVIQSRYGLIPSPLLSARDKSAVRLESLLKQMGLTLKSASSMGVIEQVAEESSLEKFVKNKTKKEN